jgi:hypothetical protein
LTRTTIALALAGLSLVTAGPAAAKGGNKTPAPTPPPVVQEPADVCEGYWDTVYPDGSGAVVNRGIGGCVIVRSYTAGYLRLDRVVLLPGWTYTVKSNGEGSNSRVLVDFSNPATGQKGSVLTEYGKTVVK